MIAPHPDDETICCSGVISHAVEHSWPVMVAFLTNGDQYGIRIGMRRQAEAVKALNILGVPESSLVFLGYPDNQLDELPDNASQVLKSRIGFIF